MANSSNSDDIKPVELTEEEKNDLQILLNKLWNLQSFTNQFNKNIEIMFSDFRYVLENIDPSLKLNSYFDTLKTDTESFKNSIMDARDMHQNKIKTYLDKLRTFKMANTWNNDYIKENVIPKPIPNELSNKLKNYFSNLSAFDLPSGLCYGNSEIFYESVLGSEPLYLFYHSSDEVAAKEFVSKLPELQQNKIRMYTDGIFIPIGLVANLIAWDFIHLVDNNIFETNIVKFFYKILRPGGTITLNYPSIFNPEDFDLITRHIFGVYDPFYMEGILTKIGFEIVKHDLDNQIVYAKKPGILNTGKASPTISTIVNIDSLLQNK